MNNLKDTQQVEDTHAAYTIGQHLRYARERCGMQLHVIAEQLNLKPALLQAIEDDDLEKMPQAVFVRGYIRSYSAILDIDSDSLIRSFERSLIINDKGKTVVQIGTPSKNTSILEFKLDDKYKYAIISVAVVMFLGIIYSFIPEQSDDTDLQQTIVESENDDQAIVSIDNSGNQIKPASISDVSEETVLITTAETKLIETSSEITSQEIELPKTETKVVNVDENTGAIQMQLALPVISTDQKVARNEKQKKLGILEDPELAAVEEKKKNIPLLRLIFKKDAWVEIKDANKKRVLAGIQKKGSSRNIKGKLPFSLVIGNSKFVTVEFKGEVFNQKPFARGSVARFSLKEDN